MLKVTRAAAVVALAGFALGSAAQDIFWTGGNSNWNQPLNWNPNNVPNSASESAHILSPAGINVNLDISTTILDLEVGPNLTLTIDPGRVLSIEGNLANTGLITLNPTTSVSNSRIAFNNNAVISGSGGILRLAGGSDDAQLNTAVGVSLENAAEHTIDGAGRIQAALTNNGVISAIETGFGNELSLTVNNKVNNNIMQAGQNAVMVINGITVTQGAGGFIAANSGGEVRFTGSQTITGGRILGPGLLTRANNGSLTLNDVLLEGDLNMGIGANLFYNGAIFNCTGDIIVNDSSSVSNSLVQFNTDTTITGGGSIFLAGGGNDSQVSTAAGMTLTVAPGFTIEGSGEIHATLTNNGLLRAFPSANGDGELFLRTNDKANNAMIVAEPGGIVEVSGITITQGALGVLLAFGGEIEFAGSQTITGGTVRATNGGTITRENSGSTTFNDVVLDGDLDMGIAANLFYNGATFQNNGVIAVNDSSNASNALVQFNTDTTITGGGSIFLAGGGDDSQLTTAAGKTLTIDAGHTVEGSGQVRADLINNGLIRAFPSANGDGRLQLMSGNKTNNAQIVAQTGGVVEISGITLTQGSAGLILADGGQIEFAGSQTVDGGTIRAINGGTTIRKSNGTLNLSDVSLEGDLELQPAGNLNYNSDTFVNSGTVIVNDTTSASNSVLQFTTDCVITGGGSIFLAGGGDDSQLTTDAGVVLTIDPGFTVEGSGQVRADLINNGLIRAFPSANGDGRLQLMSGNKTNNAQIVAQTGGVVEISGITLTQGSAGLILADGGQIEFTGSQMVSGGTIRAINGGTTIRKSNGTLNLSDMSLEGDLELQPAGNLNYNSDTFVNNGAVIINDTTSASNSVLQFTTDCTVTGSGLILLGGGNEDSQIVTTAGATATFDTGQTIKGEGRLNGNFIINGTLAPGLPVGEITSGPATTLILGPDSVLEADTDANGSGDSLVLTNNAVNIDGHVRVSLVGGYVPAINDEFNLITAGAINGLFDDVLVTGGILPANFDVRLVYTPTTVDVKFVCISDLAEPFGVLDLADVTGFVSAFISQDPLADLAEPIGTFDLADINTFIQNFLSGCN